MTVTMENSALYFQQVFVFGVQWLRLHSKQRVVICLFGCLVGWFLACISLGSNHEDTCADYCVFTVHIPDLHLASNYSTNFE